MILKFAFYLSIIILLIPVIMTYCVVGTHVAFGQNATAPTPILPTPVPTTAPTSPNPNLQYLQQKAYVQAYAPEVGLPANSQPLQVVPQVVQAPAPAVQTQTVGGIGVGDIISMVASAGAGLAAKLGFDKAKQAQKSTDKNEVLVKETMAAEGKSKDQIGELARLLFEWNEQKSNELNGNAPSVKLETLKDDKEAFADKTAKA